MSTLSEAIAAAKGAQTAASVSLDSAIARIQADKEDLTSRVENFNAKVAELQAEFANRLANVNAKMEELQSHPDAGEVPEEDTAALKALQEATAAKQAKLDSMKPASHAKAPAPAKHSTHAKAPAS